MKRYIRTSEEFTKPRHMDTPRSLDKNGYYQVEKWGSDGKVADYDVNNYKDTVGLIKGYHYEELVPGDGMWVKPGSKYSFSVERVR